MRRSLQREEIKTVDEMNKAKTEIDRLYGTAEKEVKNVTETLEGIKKQFGDLSNLSDRLKSMKKEVDDMTKNRDKTSKEVNVLLQELKAIDVSDPDKILAHTKKLEKITEGMDKTANEVTEINTDLENVKSDMSNLSK